MSSRSSRSTRPSSGSPATRPISTSCRTAGRAWRIVLGDARLSMGGEANGSFSLIVLDAFSGDAIPVHLLTREAMRIYLAKLADGGLIALHISNNYVDLEPGRRGSWPATRGSWGWTRTSRRSPRSELNQGRMTSHWVVLARRPADLSRLAGRPGWRPLAGQRRAAVWSDDYTDLLSLLRW